MMSRSWALSLAPLLAASSAYAQAPGDVAPEPPPQYAPVPAPATDPCVHVPAMARRWAIGLSFGAYGVAPQGAPEGSEAQFRVGEVAIRYRASRRLELELAMSGGREMIDDETEGDLATGSVTLAVRYRFRPERRWNWFVMGGLGGTVIAPHESTGAEREGATRPLGMLGIGVERRFRRFALQAELRTVGLGARQDATASTPPIAVDGGPAPTMPVERLPESGAATHADELGGGMFTFGASYYF